MQCITSRNVFIAKPSVRSASRPRIVAHVSRSDTTAHIDRRAAVGFLLLPSLLGASAAFAKDPEKTGSASNDRKEALRETAQEIKRTGEDKDPFPGNTFGMTDSTHGGKSPDKFPRQEESIRNNDLPNPFP